MYKPKKDSRSPARKAEDTIRNSHDEVNKITKRIEELEALNNELSFVLFIVSLALIASFIYIGIAYE